MHLLMILVSMMSLERMTAICSGNKQTNPCRALARMHVSLHPPLQRLLPAALAPPLSLLSSTTTTMMMRYSRSRMSPRPPEPQQAQVLEAGPQPPEHLLLQLQARLFSVTMMDLDCSMASTIWDWEVGPTWDSGASVAPVGASSPTSD